MLSDVLNYLKKGGEARVSTIARKLDMEEGTVEMLIDQLIKLYMFTSEMQRMFKKC
ncbi:MAG: FeoC-like transcriptional regulator [Candidatus Heimdallarchaeota archaeon]